MDAGWQRFFRVMTWAIRSWSEAGWGLRFTHDATVRGSVFSAIRAAGGNRCLDFRLLDVKNVIGDLRTARGRT